MARMGLTRTYPHDAGQSDPARGSSPAPTPGPGAAAQSAPGAAAGARSGPGSTPTPAPLGRASEAQPESSLIGQHIGSYRITRELGHGGMGVVYEAVHDQLGQRAAVKTLKPELSLSQPYAQRFFTEARALSIAQHPSLVKVFDFGQLPDKTLYILMEFLEGEPLSSRLQRGPLDEAAALRLTRQIASAVQAAHERSIVHRDLKPANIFVVPDPEAPAGERVKILDFGLAKIAEGRGPGAGTQQTTTGTIMGTPLYMSPEQCRGLAHADGKTDVYSLGVLLYEMLAGSPPFVADTAGDLIAMHISQRPPALRRKVPAASPAVAALVADMLIKDAALRPTMAQVAVRLVQAASAAQAAAGSASRAGRTLGAIAGVALAVAAIAGGAHLVRSRSQPQVAGASAGPQTAALARPVPRTVWALTSDPVGAEVVRSVDRARLGRTPWRQEQEATLGHTAVLVEHPGYVSQEIELDGALSAERHVVLAPSPPVAARAAADLGAVPTPAPVAAAARPAPTARPAGKPRGAKAATPPAAAKPASPPASPMAPPARPEPPPEENDVPPMR